MAATKVETAINEIKVALEGIRAKLEHTVTWKELVGAAIALALLISAGIWFVVGLRMDDKLGAATAELKASSKEVTQAAVDAAAAGIIDRLQKEMSTLTNEIKLQTRSIEASIDAAVVGAESVGNLKGIFTRLDDLSVSISDVKSEFQSSSKLPSAYYSFPANSEASNKIFELMKSDERWKSLALEYGLDSSDIEKNGVIVVPFQNNPDGLFKN